jgi:hypothetical protein
MCLPPYLFTSPPRLLGFGARATLPQAHKWVALAGPTPAFGSLYLQPSSELVHKAGYWAGRADEVRSGVGCLDCERHFFLHWPLVSVRQLPRMAPSSTGTSPLLFM